MNGVNVHIPMGTTHWFEVLDARIKVLAGYSPAGEELAFLAGRAGPRDPGARGRGRDAALDPWLRARRARADARGPLSSERSDTGPVRLHVVE
jgi:hypothetical protein